MRLWSLSPEYLDREGLLAAWHEALLAKKVLQGKTRGYKNHPQLQRFKEQERPLPYINAYLLGLYREALSRGYKFDRRKISLLNNNVKYITVGAGQLEYEFEHLLKKLLVRDKARFLRLKDLKTIKAHALFKKVKGATSDWEKIRTL